MSEKKCEHKTGLPMFYGPPLPGYCGRKAVIQDVHGRWLCQRHYNRWVKRSSKHKKAVSK